MSVLQRVMRDRGSAALRLFEGKVAELLLFDLFPFPMSLCLLKSFLREHYLVGMHIFCSQIVKKKPARESPKRNGQSVVLSHILLLCLIIQPSMNINCKEK